MSIAAYTPFRDKAKENADVIKKAIPLVNKSMFFVNTVGVR